MDPRFDDLAGKYKDEVFKRRYSFIYDEQLPQEKVSLKKGMKVWLALLSNEDKHFALCSTDINA